MKIKGKRVLKNGAVAAYVLQKDKTWRWRIIKGPKKNYKGGNKILTKNNYFSNHRGKTLYEWNNNAKNLKEWKYIFTSDENDNIYRHNNEDKKKTFYSNNNDGYALGKTASISYLINSFREFYNPSYLDYFLYYKVLEITKKREKEEREFLYINYDKKNICQLKAYTVNYFNLFNPDEINKLTEEDKDFFLEFDFEKQLLITYNLFLLYKKKKLNNFKRIVNKITSDDFSLRARCCELINYKSGSYIKKDFRKVQVSVLGFNTISIDLINEDRFLIRFVGITHNVDILLEGLDQSKLYKSILNDSKQCRVIRNKLLAFHITDYYDKEKKVLRNGGINIESNPKNNITPYRNTIHFSIGNIVPPSDHVTVTLK